MKKLFAFILISNFLFSQGTINFDDNSSWVQDGTTSLTSYANHGYTSGVFSATGVSVLRNGNTAQDGFPGALGTFSFRLNQTSTTSLTFNIASGGVGTFSFQARRWDGSPDTNFTVEYSVNDGVDWIFSSLINASVTNDSNWKTISGTINSNNNNIKIRIKSNGTTERLMIDNFEWNSASSDPLLSITSPSNNAIFNPETTSVNIAISVSNFVVGNPGAGIDGHIHYSVNGGATVMKYDTTPITLSGLTPGTYSIAMQLVDNNHNALNPTVNANVSFTVASYIVVNNIAEMRQDVVSSNVLGRYYQINSNPVITYTRTNRNQKYIQDASAAVLIDDNTPAPGIITTPMVIGDAIAGLKGFTTSFLGGLQFTPLTNATVASNGNTVTPQVVTINDLNSNLNAYESELVRVNNLTFTDAGSTFAVNTNYNVTNNSETLVFRTLFGEANYITQTIPSGEQDIVAIVARNNALAQIVARNLSDITLDVTSFDAISGLKMYPNPAKNGQTLFITSDSSVEKNVAIYNMLGRKVLETTTQQNTINTNGLITGVYMVKITEEGKTSTKKLVIQ